MSDFLVMEFAQLVVTLVGFFWAIRIGNKSRDPFLQKSYYLINYCGFSEPLWNGVEDFSQ